MTITKQHTDTDIAEHLERAAQMIDTAGLNRGGYWEGPLRVRYVRDTPVDAVGALAITYGLTLKLDVDEHFAGVPFFHQRSGDYVGKDVHPALAALMADLAFTKVEQVFEWSDNAEGYLVVDSLRSLANELRSRDALATGSA